MQALLEFQATLAVVQKNAASIGRVVVAIARAQLCPAPEPRGEGAPVVGMQEFQDLAETHRAEVPGLDTPISTSFAAYKPHPLCSL